MDQKDPSQPMNRRNLLGKIGAFGLAALGLAGCATKPPGAGDATRGTLASERRRIDVISLQQRTAIIQDVSTGQQYRVVFLTYAPPGSPELDCVAETERGGPRTTVLPGLNLLLDPLHRATQQLKVGGCDVYFNVTEPLVRNFQQSINLGIDALNQLEVHPYVLGATDDGGRIIRAVEDPNRLIVVEPFISRRAHAPLLNRLLQRTTSPKPTGLA